MNQRIGLTDSAYAHLIDLAYRYGYAKRPSSEVSLINPNQNGKRTRAKGMGIFIDALANLNYIDNRPSRLIEISNYNSEHYNKPPRWSIDASLKWRRIVNVQSQTIPLLAIKADQLGMVPPRQFTANALASTLLQALGEQLIEPHPDTPIPIYQQEIPQPIKPKYIKLT